MARADRTAIAFVLAALLTACGGSADSGSSTELTGTRLDPPFDVAATPLEDTGGAPYSLTEDTDAPLTLVFFGYTHCPDICGQVMATLAGTMTRLSDADRERVDVVFVTTDPARDDAATVADYVEAYDDDFVGLTGDQAAITEVAASAKVAIGYFDGAKEVPAAELDPARTYDVDHGTQVFGLDDEGFSTFWRADVSQAELAQDVHVLLGESGDEG